MAGLDPAIPIGRAPRLSHRDHRVKPGNDNGTVPPLSAASPLTPLACCASSLLLFPHGRGEARTPDRPASAWSEVGERQRSQTAGSGTPSDQLPKVKGMPITRRPTRFCSASGLLLVAAP